MSKKYEDLKELLLELFQLDQPDLDFGLYRVLAVRRDEIVRYLDRDLRGQVSAAFAGYRSADKTELEQQLQVAIGQAQQLGADPDSLPKVKELREKLRTQVVDVAGLEADVYNHLFRFFRRYYSEGDFLSKRVYKKDTYAIPYEGEEVMLHWANKDQYYIKTSEYLKDYAFRLRPDDAKNPMRVHFRLADVAEGEHGNAKAVAGKDRRFQLAGDDAIGVENGELIIRFNYEPSELAQKVLNEAAAKAVLGVQDPGLKDWVTALQQVTKRKDGSEGPSRLRMHLDRYTARNTFDYFIHKDLGPFLKRELDFYIKNEVMHLDDIESSTAPRVEQYLSKLRAMRAVAHSIIAFLAQLEDFQKTLWLKKKFVVETSYCVRVGLLPEGMLAEVAGNDAQREEWVELCGIDGIRGDLASPGYSRPLTVEFLEAHHGLMVDTRLFGAEFTQRALAGLGDVDGQTDGVLFNSENFQALQLMQAKYHGTAKCVYIDPPYNAKTSEIAYKNTYKHSSWLSLIFDRLRLSANLSTDDGSHVIAIDENEQEVLGQLVGLVWPTHEKVCISVVHNKKGIQGDYFAHCHEFAYFVLPPALPETHGAKVPSDQWEYTNLRKWGRESERSTAKNCFYPILVRGDEIIDFLPVSAETFHPGRGNVASDGGILVYPVDAKGVERKWRYALNTVAGIRHLLRVHRTASGEIQIVKAVDEKPNKSLWDDSRYIAGDHGTKWLTDLGLKLAEDIYPKSLHLVEDSIRAVSEEQCRVVDYFGGSGTTGHAVIAANLADGGRRQFVLAEINQYFDKIILPRLKKITYTPEWSGGRPKRLATPEETDRSPRILKILRLESYEDTLNNLDLRRTQAQQALLDTSDADPGSTFSADYRLQYMLPTESRGSPSLLNIAAFADPTAYTLDVKVPGSDETQRKAVDLLETFNWLLGLTVRTIEAPEIYAATFDANAEGRITIKQFRPDPTGPYWFRRVTGVLRDERKVLIIWRKQTGNPTHDNIALDEYGRKLNLNTLDSEFDLVYVNGGNNLQNLRHPDDTWKVRLIEEEFQRLMFATEGV